MSKTPRKTAKARSLPSEDDALEMMLSAANQITEELIRYARKYRAIGEHDEFPEDLWTRAGLRRNRLSPALADSLLPILVFAKAGQYITS